MSLETLDESGLPYEIRVNNFLHANNPDGLHEFLDVSPIFAAEICQRFRHTARKLFELMRAEEKRGGPLQTLREDWDRARRDFIAEAIREAQRHD